MEKIIGTIGNCELILRSQKELPEEQEKEFIEIAKDDISDALMKKHSAHWVELERLEQLQKDFKNVCELLKRVAPQYEGWLKKNYGRNLK